MIFQSCSPSVVAPFLLPAPETTDAQPPFTLQPPTLVEQNVLRNPKDGDSVPDCKDGCPLDPAKTEPGVCGCFASESDGDGDGTPDCADHCPLNSALVRAATCGCGAPSVALDAGPSTAHVAGPPAALGVVSSGARAAQGPTGDASHDSPSHDADADARRRRLAADPMPAAAAEPLFPPAAADPLFPAAAFEPLSPPAAAETLPLLSAPSSGAPDTDGDGTPDCQDGCPLDPRKQDAGVCGCSTPDDDDDADGTPNCVDACPRDPRKTRPGVCGCSLRDGDRDGDGQMDCIDVCPDNPLRALSVGPCGCRAGGRAGGGLPRAGFAQVAQGRAGDGHGSGFSVAVDDDDSDGDGAVDCADECPNDPQKTRRGICGCGTADVDTDGDGALDCANDLCPLDPAKTDPGACGCGANDSDGVRRSPARRP
jgi:hypothetical protein